MILNNKTLINYLKYFLILSSAFLLSFLIYENLAQDFTHQVVNGLFQVLKAFLSDNSSLATWLFFSSCLIISLLSLISPFVILIVTILRFLKPNWLPNDDQYLLKPLHYWMGVILILFFSAIISRLFF